MIRPEHPFDIRPDLRKAETTNAETTTAETVIRPKQLVRPKNNRNTGFGNGKEYLVTQRTFM